MAIQVGITSFRYNTAGATVNFTDPGGAEFIPDYIYLINGSSLDNTLYSNGSGNFNTWSFNQNLTEVATSKSVNQSNAENPQLGLKMVTGAEGGGLNAALNSFESDIFFGGNVYRSCKITAVGSGFFTYTIVSDANFFTTDVIAVCVKGISLEFVGVGVAGTYSTSFDPKGVWTPRLTQWSNTNSGPFSGTGGANNGWGADSPNGGPFSVQTLIQLQDGNFRYVTTDSYSGTIDSSGPSTSIAGKVTDWGTNQLTVTAGTARLYVIGGDNVITATGSFNLSQTTGDQVFEIGIWAKLLFTITVGTDEVDELLSDYGEVCFGATNGTDAVSFWYGERTNGNILPLQGACYISSNSLIRAVDNTGVQSSSTVFGAVADIVELSPFGNGTIHLSVADSKARKVYWLAIGTETQPLPPNAAGGIYKLIPTKKQDTVWIDVDTEDEALFKIPDPNAYTGLVGDE